MWKVLRKRGVNATRLSMGKGWVLASFPLCYIRAFSQSKGTVYHKDRKQKWLALLNMALFFICFKVEIDSALAVDF